MSWMKKITWRWKVPALVIVGEFLLVLALPLLFPASQSKPLQWAYVILAYPFSGHFLAAIIWLVLLYSLGFFIDSRLERRSAL